MKSTLGFIDAHPEIFLPLTVNGAVQPLDHERRMIVLLTWQAFLDHILFLTHWVECIKKYMKEQWVK